MIVECRLFLALAFCNLLCVVVNLKRWPGLLVLRPQLFHQLLRGGRLVVSLVQLWSYKCLAFFIYWRWRYVKVSHHGQLLLKWRLWHYFGWWILHSCLCFLELDSVRWRGKNLFTLIADKLAGWFNRWLRLDLDDLTLGCGLTFDYLELLRRLILWQAKLAWLLK